MKPAERKHQVEQLFLDAADLPLQDRPAFLASACGGDVELRQEVESLLEYDSQDAPGIAAIVDQEVSGITSAMRSGDRVGPYQILRELGHGGMGTVYLADRADNQ